MNKTAKSADSFSYDKAISQVESIVKSLENYDGKTSFDELIDNVEQAKQLIENCKQCVLQAEDRLNKMMEK